MLRWGMPAFTTRRLLAAGALLAVGFAVYGSLVPLDVQHMTFREAVALFRALRYTPFAFASKTDFLSNVALFLPIGFLSTGAIAAGRSRLVGLLMVPIVVLFAAGLSLSIEFAQIFIPDRTASLNDMANETAGAIVGAIAWVIAGPMVTGWMAGFAPAKTTSTDLARRLLTAYAAVWLMLGLLPFDVTIRPAEIAEKFRLGRIHLDPLHGGVLAAAPVIVSTALLALPIGALAALGWPRPRRSAAPAQGTLAATAVVVLLEACQLFIFARTASVDDVIGGAIGATTGAHWAARMQGRPHSASTGLRLWPLAVLAVWIALILVRHWSPFDFEVTGDMFRQRSPALLQVPFRNYYWANPFEALAEAITKIFLGLPVGALLMLTFRPSRSAVGRLLQWSVVACAGFALFAGVEVGQVFLPSRYPDGTDIVLGAFGVCASAWGTRLVQAAGRAASDVVRST